MQGYAYVFLKRDGAPLPPGAAGHVGWGFTEDDVIAYCGSTENYTGGPFVSPGGNNGYWGMKVRSQEQMLKLFRDKNYHAYKFEKVEKRAPDYAKAMALETKNAGYRAIGSNCLDHVYSILKAYGVQDLPWPSTHPSPNDWYAVFNGIPNHL